MKGNNNLQIVLLSGPIAVGKSSLTKVLTEVFNFKKISTGEFLVGVCESQKLDPNRANLQYVGDELDATTDFEWVVTDVALPNIESSPETRKWLLDSVRKNKQILHFKNRFPNSINHVHLIAAESTLEARYNYRKSISKDERSIPTYKEAINHLNEVSARSLIEVAELVINTDDKSPQEIAEVIIGFIGGR